MPDDSFLNSPRSRFRAAMILAMGADALQILGFPLFVEGALSPLDEIRDVIVAVEGLLYCSDCKGAFGVPLLPDWQNSDVKTCPIMYTPPATWAGRLAFECKVLVGNLFRSRQTITFLIANLLAYDGDTSSSGAICL
jgi:hypothetical protein